MENNFFEKKEKRTFIQDKNIEANFPKNCLIELTNACNHECIFCTNPKMQRGITRIDINVYQDFLKNAVKNGLEELGLYTTGEPFMTKNLDEFIELAKNLGVKRVYLTTNGSLATLEKVKTCIEKGLDSIKFSINAGSRETYKFIHGKDDFDKVIKNVEDIFNYIKENDKNIQLLCSFVTTKVTEKEVPKFKKLYSKFFEDIVVLPTINQGGRIEGEIFNKGKDKKNIKLTDEEIKSAKPCEYLWERIVLTAEGNLTACCADFDNDLIYSKYNPQENLTKQYNSESMKYLRKKHLSHNLDNTICKNCVFNTNEKFKKLQNIDYKKQDLNKKKIDHLKNRIELISTK